MPMNRLMPALLACTLLSPAPAALPAEEPRALIERAIRAMGGEEALGSKAAVSMKIKGRIHMPGGGDLEVSFTGEIQTHTSGRNRTVLNAEFMGQTISMIQVS